MNIYSRSLVFMAGSLTCGSLILTLKDFSQNIVSYVCLFKEPIEGANFKSILGLRVTKVNCTMHSCQFAFQILVSVCISDSCD